MLFDVWFGAAETLRFIHHRESRSIFICPLKPNRLKAKTLKRGNRKFIPGSEVELENQESVQEVLKGLEFPVQIVKQDLPQERPLMRQNCRFSAQRYFFKLLPNAIIKFIKKDGNWKNFTS